MTRKILMLTAVVAVFGLATNVSAQLANGEFWRGNLSGRTRIVETPIAEPVEGGLELSDASTLTKGKLKKTQVYFLTEWNGKDAYDVTVWTQDSGQTAWIRQDDAGQILPFGEGFPDSRDAVLEVFVNLAPIPDVVPAEGIGGEEIVFVDGLVTLKLKEDKKAPMTDGVNEIQVISAGTATMGTFVLSYEGEATAALDYNADDATVLAALEGLKSIGTGNIQIVTEPEPSEGDPEPAGEWTVEFIGALAATDVPSINVDTNDTDGTVQVSVSQAGSPASTAVLKSGNIKLDGTGARMDSDNFGGPNIRLLGGPKLSVKRVAEDKLPFDPAPMEK